MKIQESVYITLQFLLFLLHICSTKFDRKLCTHFWCRRCTILMLKKLDILIYIVNYCLSVVEKDMIVVGNENKC